MIPVATKYGAHFFVTAPDDQNQPYVTERVCGAKIFITEFFVYSKAFRLLFRFTFFSLLDK